MDLFIFDFIQILNDKQRRGEPDQKSPSSKAIFMDDAREASGFTTGNATCSHADFSHALTQISTLGVGRKSDHLNPIHS